MAVGNTNFPVMQPVTGIRLGTACAGIKQTDRDDLLVIEMQPQGSCAAVFTRNAFCAAPVVVARENLHKTPHWILVNSGNANAGTGTQGLLDTWETCSALAASVSSEKQKILPFSTGVIGEMLPVDKIKRALPGALENLSAANWLPAAKAIMTTDTFAKGAAALINIEGHEVAISGIAKGAGMIQPNMATMLAFIATDAKIGPALLQHCLQQAVEQSFNRITVDGDTSTNDACVVLASAASSASQILPDSNGYQIFADALLGICKQLAEAIVRDGEGATKLLRITVAQAQDDEEAVKVGKTIAHSPLVKTAFFASDPNWGRILAAVGRADIKALKLNKVQIFLGNVCIVKEGGRAPAYSEQAAQQVMNETEIQVTINLGRGAAKQEVLSCDLSYDYVRINAEYRT